MFDQKTSSVSRVPRQGVEPVAAFILTVVARGISLPPAGSVRAVHGGKMLIVG